MVDFLDDTEIAELKELVRDVDEHNAHFAVVSGMCGYDVPDHLSDAILDILKDAIGAD